MAFDFDLEMEFTAGNWTSVKADVIRDPIVAFWGAQRCGPNDHMASTGTCQFTLNNSATNSNGTLGWYSPTNGSARSGFAIGTALRVKYIDGANVQYKKFYISKIDPAAGIYGPRGTKVMAVDYIGRMSVQYADSLTILNNQNLSECFTALIGKMPVAPVNADYSAGISDLPSVFHDVDGRKMTIYNIAVRLLASSFGYFFIGANATDGERAVYDAFQDRSAPSSSLTLADTMNELDAPIDQEKIYNDITGISYPLEVGATNEVLWTLQEEITIAPGESKTVTVRYKDPQAKSSTVRLATGTQVDPLVADTDYKFSDTSGDSGNDLNASLGFTSIDWFADRAVFVVKNNAAVTGYLNLLKPRGHLVRINDPIETQKTDTAANLAKYGVRPLRFPMPYQANPFVVNDFRDYIFNAWHLPQTHGALNGFLFTANRTPALTTAGVLRDVGDKVTVTETVTGIDADYIIGGIEKTILPGKILKVKIYPEYVGTMQQWLWGTAGFCEWGETTVWGLGS